MKSWAIILALLCVAATLPKVYRHAEVTQGAGALALIAKPKIVMVPVLPTTNWFAWKYPSNINPSNYYWDVTERRWTNGWSSWCVAISNSTTPGRDTVFISRTNKPIEWRLRGRLTE